MAELCRCTAAAVSVIVVSVQLCLSDIRDGFMANMLGAFFYNPYCIYCMN